MSKRKRAKAMAHKKKERIKTLSLFLNMSYPKNLFLNILPIIRSLEIVRFSS